MVFSHKKLSVHSSLFLNKFTPFLCLQYQSITNSLCQSFELKLIHYFDKILNFPSNDIMYILPVLNMIQDLIILPMLQYFILTLRLLLIILFRLILALLLLRIRVVPFHINLFLLLIKTKYKFFTKCYTDGSKNDSLVDAAEYIEDINDVIAQSLLQIILHNSLL